MAQYNFASILSGGDALIIVPPFASLDRPSLAAHVLQSCAREAGFGVSVLYANILLAAEIGEVNYAAICYAPSSIFAGERFFAVAAYGVDHADSIDKFYVKHNKKSNLKIAPSVFRKHATKANVWIDNIARAILKQQFKVVGCTTVFEQTAASVALLNRIKELSPDTLTIIGGANCEGEMAEGIVSLNANLDFIFEGESESSFPKFLKTILSGELPENRIIHGDPTMNLDEIPVTDFSEYYDQYNHFLPNDTLITPDLRWLPYEASRGCWWGEKHHCTFCGINGEIMKFRQKSPDRVISELKQLIKQHPSNKVCMVDNIMPYTYFRTLMPRLGSEAPDLHIFYEQKANLSLDKVVALKKAGVAIIQPGIEALSSSLLKLMDKGVSAQQNIALLRYARAVGLSVNWNILYAFPGDRLHQYDEMLALLPLLRHLNPPIGLFHLSIDRFSPYFDRPAAYGVTNIRPLEGYKEILPKEADIFKVAYHFVADYQSDSRENSEIIGAISEEIGNWQDSWIREDSGPPTLTVTPLSSDQFLLLDTRGLSGTQEIQFLSRNQVSVVLTGIPTDSRKEIAWAIERKLIVELDGRFVPLVTAEPELLQEFEIETHKSQQKTRKFTQSIKLDTMITQVNRI